MRFDRRGDAAAARDAGGGKSVANNNLPAGGLRLGATATELTGLLSGMLRMVAGRFTNSPGPHGAHLRPAAFQEGLCGAQEFSSPLSRLSRSPNRLCTFSARSLC